MKIIDILVKIANGEALPEKIKFENNIYYAYHYENRIIDYYYIDELKNQITLFEDSMHNYGITSYLNDEVEIIEEIINPFGEYEDTSKEEKKIPGKLDDFTIAVGSVDESNIEEYIQTLFNQQYEIFNKINSIIDYLKSKGDE